MGGQGSEGSMASFERERAFVGHLLNRLALRGEAIDPNAMAGQETGIDVAVQLEDGRTIGIQVTEIDPYPERGKARAEEKTIAKAAPDKPYGMLGQNDPSVALDAIADRVKRKVEIATRHLFDGLDEVWLLICAGVPEHGAVVSTFVMSPWLSADDLNSATDNLLHPSKYSRCFLLPILGAEQAFYRWERNLRWKKSVKLEDIRDVPREAYVNGLMEAAGTGSWEEVDRLCDEECRKVLTEMRQG
jgi:hypothetical protein